MPTGHPDACTRRRLSAGKGLLSGPGAGCVPGHCYPLRGIGPLVCTEQAGDRTMKAGFCTIRRSHSGADLAVRRMIQRMSLQLPAVYQAFHRATWLHVLSFSLPVRPSAGRSWRWRPFSPPIAAAATTTMPPTNSSWVSPFDSGLHLPPGYSLFLAAILAVTEGSTAAAMLVQHLLGLAAGLLVYLIGRRLFGPLVGLVAALLTVLDVELALYEHAVMTETLFALLLICALALVLLRSAWLHLAAGSGLRAAGRRRNVWSGRPGFYCPDWCCSCRGWSQRAARREPPPGTPGAGGSGRPVGEYG